MATGQRKRASSTTITTNYSKLHKTKPQDLQVLRRKVLSRVYEPKTEIATLLSESNSPFADVFSDAVWHAQVAHVADVSEHFEDTVFLNRAFTGHVSRGRTDMLPSIWHEMQQQLDTAGRNALTKAMAHPAKLQHQFNDYFPEKRRNGTPSLWGFHIAEKEIQQGEPLYSCNTFDLIVF